MGFIKKHIKFFSFLLFLLIWSILLYNISPEEAVQRFGIENGYLASFVVSFLASISTITNFPYQLVIIALAKGGLNPIILGILASFGEILGDSISYLIGYHGHQALPQNIKGKLLKFTNWCIKAPPWMTFSALFLYGAFIPLPNDLLIVPLALARFPYKKMIIPLLLGNILFNTAVAFVGLYL